MIENTRTKLKVIFVGLACALFTACSAPTGNPSAENGVSQQTQTGATIDPPKLMPDFELVNQDGQPTRLRDLRGKPTLFAFAYTHCPDICPMTIADFTRVKKAMGDAASVNYVMISVDGERDTPAVLKNYLSSFDAGFVGLTGAPGIVATIAENYGAKFSAEKPSGTSASYLVSHTSFMYLLDERNRWRKTYAFQTSAQPIANDIRQLISEKDTPQSDSVSSVYADDTVQAIYMQSPVQMPNFALVDQHAQPFKFADLRGKWALMYFGSTQCPRKDCPPDVLAQWREVKQQLGAKDNLRYVMLSVDPNYDTPQVLKQFVESYDKEFIALTGGNDYVAPIAVKYGVHIADTESHTPKKYIAHSVYSVLINPEGKWVVAFPFKMNAKDMTAALKKIIGD